MEQDTGIEREIRRGRNQSLFRAVNEQMVELNRTFAGVTDVFEIACECADPDCLELVALHPSDYFTVRANPRHFAVLPGHVYPDVERVVAEHDGFVVVEKVGAAAEVAEQAR